MLKKIAMLLLTAVCNKMEVCDLLIYIAPWLGNSKATFLKPCFFTAMLKLQREPFFSLSYS